MLLRRSSGRSFWRSLVLETLEERSFLDRLAKKGCLMDAVERTRMNQVRHTLVGAFAVKLAHLPERNIECVHCRY